MHDDKKYKIKLEIGSLKCHKCKQEGHFVKNCPQVQNPVENATPDGVPIEPPKTQNTQNRPDKSSDTPNSGSKKRDRELSSAENSPVDTTVASASKKKPKTGVESQEHESKGSPREERSFSEDENCMTGNRSGKNPPNVYDILKNTPLPPNSAYNSTVVVDWIISFFKKNSYEASAYKDSWKSAGLDPFLLYNLVVCIKDETPDKWRIKEKLRNTTKNWPSDS
jgi:hypothetical protein